MTEDEQRKLASLMGTLKGTIISTIPANKFEQFILWCNKLAQDTYKDKSEKTILKELKSERDTERQRILYGQKKKYLPHNYPTTINIGDIVYINFGYGYCSEISDGHYGVVMSELKANMYFIIPCSSEELRILPFPIKLGVPNREHNNNKTSYLRFDQMRMIHYRRIENIIAGSIFNIGDENIELILNKLDEFFG